jgi:hypothetical protein
MWSRRPANVDQWTQIAKNFGIGHRLHRAVRRPAHLGGINGARAAGAQAHHEDAPVDEPGYSRTAANTMLGGGRSWMLGRGSMLVDGLARSPVNVVVRICKAGVGGSIPLVSTNLTFENAGLDPGTPAIERPSPDGRSLVGADDVCFPQAASRVPLHSGTLPSPGEGRCPTDRRDRMSATLQSGSVSDMISMVY